jgi:hypothetical protein
LRRRQRNSRAPSLRSTGDESCNNHNAGLRIGVSWVLALYLIVGGIVAATHHYWSHVHTLKGIASGVLGTLLWPLLLAGINLHIH